MDKFKGKAKIPNMDCCIGCLLCELRCPDFAIDVVEENDE
jgi:2-oxoglutarate ferredoxin oxidoreductase subunit delta